MIVYQIISSMVRGGFKLGKCKTVEVKSIKIGNSVLGLDSFHVWAGPCAIESEEQFLKTAQFVQSQGCSGLRAGMFKLRTSAKNFRV